MLIIVSLEAVKNVMLLSVELYAQIIHDCIGPDSTRKTKGIATEVSGSHRHTLLHLNKTIDIKQLKLLPTCGGGGWQRVFLHLDEIVLGKTIIILLLGELMVLW